MSGVCFPGRWIPAFLFSVCLVFCFSACSGRRSVNESGLHFAHLGEEMPLAGIGRLKGHAVKDTLCSENGFQWRVAMLNYAKGRVWIEEDFFGGNVINRIRIETPEIRLRNGMQVGITVDRLRNSVSEWYVNPMPLYGKFDFYSTLLPGFHFVVDDPSRPMDSENYRDYDIASFDSAAKVVAIVVY